MIRPLLGALILISSLAAHADVFEAAGRADLKALRKEVKTAAQANARDGAGETLLIKAADAGDVKVLRFLLDKGADVNARDNEGNTALFYAVSANLDEAANLLISRKADLTLVYGAKEENILFEAARVGALDAMKTIVKKDKSLVNQKNLDGETPLFEAHRSAQSKAVEILVKAGAKKDLVNKAGKKAGDL